MIIEIKGTGSHNKGAEMMLLTILEQLNSADFSFSVAPVAGSCDYSFYSKLGLLQKFWFVYRGIQMGRFGSFIPRSFLRNFGMVAEGEINAVLDASGFAYSSQWGDTPTENMARDSLRWRKQGKRIVLMPQAFGPFESRKIREDMLAIIKNCDLLYARDETSYNHLRNLSDSGNIKTAPDFTVLFHGTVPDYFKCHNNHVCLVPNMRMFDKTGCGEAYFKLFLNIIGKIHARGCIPFFLIHGGKEDFDLACEMNKSLNNSVRIINETNPYFIKGIIECSVAVIGSRFHSLASALYSGIPALGTGWSHKYVHLFQDAGFPEGMLDLNSDASILDAKLDMIFDSSESVVLRDLLIASKKRQEDKVKNMFQEIERVLRWN